MNFKVKVCVIMLITTKLKIFIKNMQNSNNYCYIKIFLFLKILCQFKQHANNNVFMAVQLNTVQLECDCWTNNRSFIF